MRLRVEDDGFDDLVDDLVVQLAVEESVLSGVLHEDVLGVEVDDFHLFCGHSASLAEAKIRDETDLFNRVDVTHQDIIELVHEED